MNHSSLRSVHDLATDAQTTLDISKELLEELSLWYQAFKNLPPEDTGEVDPFLTLNGLGYHYLQMTIFRAIMRPFLANTSSNFQTRDVLEELSDSSDTAHNVRGFARTGVRSVTTAASIFVKGLKEEQFHMFWPHWSQVAFSSICFLDLMMAASSADTDESLAWFRDLHAIRKEMRFKSTMLPVLRLGLLRIDAVFWKGLNQVLELQPYIEEAYRASLKGETISSSRAVHP